MKETYYKLNREKMIGFTDDDLTIKRFIKCGILEEVQEESKQAIDNMFGNPLKQVDTLVASVEFKGKNNDTHTLQVYDNSLPIGLRTKLSGEDCCQLFLDGSTPSEYIESMFDDEPIRGVQHVLNLLVEELKRNNVIK
jgi:hypothetical protein